jgi:hypothetical protein
MKGNIKTGTLYLVLVMFLLVVVGAQLTQGLVPTNLPNDTGTVVTPVFDSPASSQNQLQLYTFGFVTGVPTTAPTPEFCPNNDFRAPSCGTCPNFEAMACDEAPDPCDPGSRIMQLPSSDPNASEYCVYVKDNDEAKYNEKRSDPRCRAACVSTRN